MARFLGQGPATRAQSKRARTRWGLRCGRDLLPRDGGDAPGAAAAGGALAPSTRTSRPRRCLPHRAWVPQFLNVFVQAYNTSLVRKEDLPKSYAEGSPTRGWKGCLDVEASDSEWYCGVLRHAGAEKGAKLFRDIRCDGRLVGERRPYAAREPGRLRRGAARLTVYSYRIEQLKARGRAGRVSSASIR